ncbi:PH domain-containing protein [Anaerocolumna sedimenticola]|uniref:PH domain-containing protein n=1 Tax=Anaerocolumna sedimenticola TaxID=2696063 RepID=A0A6P1TKN2_9FIRM|nr:PH domain-containing protein [Anaerocolumna sedimenticola]QHQ60466.1 PH domain-containing protein [Anaerocolumna sedimenticola]
MAFGMKNILQGGLAANYSEAPIAELEKEYSQYLMDGEKITMGFKLVRDALIFTNKRIIMTDKQGATGTKMKVTSINLLSIVNVSMETSGFGFDDSELTFTYISSPELKGHHVEYAAHKLEFPKKFNVQGLYKILQELAYENYLRINNITE